MEMEGQKPPAKGGHLRWGILKPGWGKKYKGWKAGPNWGFKTHHAPRSKPCVAKITAGALPCRWCSPEYPDGFTGYLPIINDEGQKLVLLYGRDFEDIISDIPFGAEIQISKGGYQSAPVIVVQKEWCGHPCPWLGRLKCQHDIRPFLLQLWKNDELKKYFGMEPAKIPVPQCHAGVTPESAPVKTLSAMLKDRMKQVEPSGNGNGKHHPKS